MDIALKNKITRTQIRLLWAIKSHQACIEKLKNGDESNEVTEEMQKLKKEMMECRDEQKILLKQLTTSDGSPSYKFDLYKIPSGATPRKNRRRKDLIQPVKNEKKTPKEVVRVRSPTPQSTSSSDSSTSGEEESDDEEKEVFSQSSLPVPLPRPSLLRKHASFSRQDVRYPKLGRKARVYKQEEGVTKELPVYNDPPPSPEPIDEYQAKLKFMAALHLIPKEALAELMTRKTERKRRSTANNQYLYNNDWEVPAIKRKQYLSPVKNKSPTQEKPVVKKGNSDEEVIAKSPEGDADDDDSIEKCKICGTRDVLVACSECDETFHPKCPTIPELEQSFLMCRRCCEAKNPTKPVENSPVKVESNKDGPDKPNEEEDAEEEVKVNLLEERLKYRNHQINILQCRMIEKAHMEKKVLQLSESLALQDRVKVDLLLESKEIGAKVDILRNFVTLYQMENGKPRVVPDLPNSNTPITNLPLSEKGENQDTPPLSPKLDSLPLTPQETSDVDVPHSVPQDPLLTN